MFWWWWEFKLGSVERWTFQLYLFVVLHAVVLCLLSALLVPEHLEEYDGYGDDFAARRGWFFGVLIVALLTDVADSWMKGPEHFASLGVGYVIKASAQVGLCGLAIVWSNARFQLAFALGMVLYPLSWAVRGYETVGWA